MVEVLHRYGDLLQAGWRVSHEGNASCEDSK